MSIFHAPTNGMQALCIEDAPAIAIGPGCLRRDLPSVAGVRTWIVDMAPGAQWPQVDHHETGEAYYVIRGEVIEGQARHGAGSYVVFAPDTRHRPRTETGVRLIGLNVGNAAFLAAGGDASLLAETWFPPQG